MAIVVSNCTKFLLLLWKNWLIMKSHKCQIAMELLLPLIFSMIFVLLRLGLKPEQNSAVVYIEFAIDDKSSFAAHRAKGSFNKIPKYELLYSPKNAFLDNIVSEAVKSLKLDEYKGFENAKTLEDDLTVSNYLAVIQFNNELANIKSYPKKLSFSLRFPTELRLDNEETWKTANLFPDFVEKGPRDPKMNEGGSPYYVGEGFIPIQHAISMSFLKLATNNELLPSISMQRYPYPAYSKDMFTEEVFFLIPWFWMFSLIYSAICITRFVTDEKEKQLKEVMKIMGLQNWIHYTNFTNIS